MRRCAYHLCPVLIPDEARYCRDHLIVRDHERASSSERGYDAAHRRLRRSWQRRMNAGEQVSCLRCGLPILPGQPWDLGHNDARDAWTGPEHAHCNRAAGAIASHRMREHWTQT